MFVVISNIYVVQVTGSLIYIFLIRNWPVCTSTYNTNVDVELILYIWQVMCHED